MLLLVSLGAIGLVLALGFAVAAIRLVRNVPLAAMVLLIGATWAVQPASIHASAGAPVARRCGLPECR